MRYFVDGVRRLVRTTDDHDTRTFGPQWKQVTGWEYDEFRKETASMSPSEMREVKAMRKQRSEPTPPA